MMDEHQPMELDHQPMEFDHQQPGRSISTQPALSDDVALWEAAHSCSEEQIYPSDRIYQQTTPRLGRSTSILR